MNLKLEGDDYSAAKVVRVEKGYIELSYKVDESNNIVRLSVDQWIVLLGLLDTKVSREFVA